MGARWVGRVSMHVRQAELGVLSLKPSVPLLVFYQPGSVPERRATNSAMKTVAVFRLEAFFPFFLHFFESSVMRHMNFWDCSAPLLN